MQKHFNFLLNQDQIDKWKSKGLSNKHLNTLGTIGDVVLSKAIKPMHVIFKVQNDNVIAGGPILNIYIVYKTSPKTINSNFVFKNCLFGAVKIANTTNSVTDKWQYSGYNVGFDSTGSFTYPDGWNGKNVIIFGADLGNSRYSNNKTQSVLVFGHGLIPKINDTTIHAEKMYSPNFTVDNKIFRLSMHYNVDNSYLFVKGKEVTTFKAKNSELIKYLICLGGFSKDYNRNSRKDTGLYGNVYDLSVDYTAISNDKIHDIHSYMMRKNVIIYIFGFIKKYFFTVMTFINFNLLNLHSLEYASMNNQECKIRPEIININTNEPLFYPYSIKVNKCKGSCNTINDPDAKICVPDEIKNTNVKVFNLM